MLLVLIWRTKVPIMVHGIKKTSKQRTITKINNKYQVSTYGLVPLYYSLPPPALSEPDLNVEGGSEQLVSAQEAGGGVQLQRGLPLRGVPPAALLASSRGTGVLFGLHLVQHRAEHLALEATHIQWRDSLAALGAQQGDLWGGTCWRGHGWLLRTTDKTLVFSLCEGK